MCNPKCSKNGRCRRRAVINSQQGESSFLRPIFHSRFIGLYGSRRTQPDHLLLSRKAGGSQEKRSDKERGIMGNGPTLRDVAEGGSVVWMCVWKVTERLREDSRIHFFFIILTTLVCKCNNSVAAGEVKWPESEKKRRVDFTTASSSSSSSSSSPAVVFHLSCLTGEDC